MPFQQMLQPNAIIFRLPDDDEGGKVFCEIQIDDEGNLADDAFAFGVSAEDTFNTMDFSTLVLAVKQSEDSSLEIASFDIVDTTDNTIAVVCEIMDQLGSIVPELVEAYNSGTTNTIQ